MKHLIKEYYYDRFDKLNYAIYVRKVALSSGTERFEPIAYQSTIRQLKRSMKEIYVKEALMNESVEELLNNLDLIDEKIKGE